MVRLGVEARTVLVGWVSLTLWDFPLEENVADDTKSSGQLSEGDDEGGATVVGESFRYCASCVWKRSVQFGVSWVMCGVHRKLAGFFSIFLLFLLLLLLLLLLCRLLFILFSSFLFCLLLLREAASALL